MLMGMSSEQAQPLLHPVKHQKDTLALKINRFTVLSIGITIVCLTMAGCTKTTSNGKKSNMESIIDGTFATDAAMQEERIEQGNYIQEQEQRYK